MSIEVSQGLFLLTLTVLKLPLGWRKQKTLGLYSSSQPGLYLTLNLKWPLLLWLISVLSSILQNTPRSIGLLKDDSV